MQEGEEVLLYDYLPDFGKIHDIENRIRVVQGDVLDSGSLEDVIKKYKVDQLIHLASVLMPESEVNPLKAVKINCEGTCRVFEAAKKTDVQRVVWTSSISVYGASKYGGKPVDENTSFQPTTVYGHCKALNEFLGQYYFDQHGLDVMGVRFTVVYGLGRTGGITAVTSKAIEAAVRGESVKIPYGDEEFNWLYVKDAVKAITQACQVEDPRYRLFIIGGFTHTFREVAEILKKLLPEAEIEVDPGKLEAYHTSHFNLSRAKKELGYEPSYTIEKGIKDQIEMMKSA